MDAYVDAVCSELHWVGFHTTGQRMPVHTVYLGGGTPSLLSPDHIARILVTVTEAFAVTPDVEISLEANPGTVDQAYFQELLAIGVNRFSLGMQSAHQAELTLFGRLHDWDDVVSAVKSARTAGVDNLSLDLIYGVPNQTRTMWQQSLAQALDLNPDHLSLYALGLENGTEMMRQVKYGLLPQPDADEVADMYDDATAMLAQGGFVQYEISNWSLPGKLCRHNIQYWRNAPYLGIGAGAHGYVSGMRTVNAMRPETYIERLDKPITMMPYPQTPATIKAEMIGAETDQFETIMMGLRLLDEGLALDEFAARYGFQLEERYAAIIEELVGWGLLRHDGNRLYLTQRARLISNQVFRRFAEAMGHPDEDETPIHMSE
jgi:oxygen-independent coproporphyrinogen-3 oxidase